MGKGTIVIVEGRTAMDYHSFAAALTELLKAYDSPFTLYSEDFTPASKMALKYSNEHCWKKEQKFKSFAELIATASFQKRAKEVNDICILVVGTGGRMDKYSTRCAIKANQNGLVVHKYLEDRYA